MHIIVGGIFEQVFLRILAPSVNRLELPTK